MSHRGRHYQNNRVLRYLDLSFQGQNHNKNGHNPSNGLRPPSQAAAKVSARRAAPRPGPRQSPVDYGAQLEADIQRLLQAESADDPATSGWPGDVTRQSTPSTQPTLLSQRSVAAGKLEQQSSTYQYNKVAGSPKPRDPSTYYRPNVSHRYLMATEKRPRTAGYQGEHRLGRPTRTTLLRARQRCNSAPITSYETRQEQHRRSEQQAEMKKQKTSQTNQSISDLLGANVPAGESLHSYLIGARYNRAHHLDDKSLKEYGVYLPRQSSGSPQNCFIIKKMRLKQRESEDWEDEENKPQAQPQRPMTASARCRTTTPPTPHVPDPAPQPTNRPFSSKRATPLKPTEAQPTLVITPQNGRSPPLPGHRQAWSEKASVEIPSASPAQTTFAVETPDAPVSIEVSNTSDGISIKGVGFIGSPPKISRPMVSHQRATGRPSSSVSDPSVMVQGRSIYHYNLTPSPVGADRPMPRPKTAVGPRRELTVRDVSERLREENQQLKEGEQLGGVPVVVDSAPTMTEPEPIKTPSVVSLSGEEAEDRVEVMSTGSDDDVRSRLHGPSPSPAGSPRLSPPASPAQESPREPDPQPAPDRVWEQDQEEPELKVEGSSEEDETSMKDGPPEEPTDRLTPIISNPNRAPSARGKRGHVRFADEVDTKDTNQDASNKDPFFLTAKDEQREEVKEGGGDKDPVVGGPVLPSVTVEGTSQVSDPAQPCQSSGSDEVSPSVNNGSGDCPVEEAEEGAKGVPSPLKELLSPPVAGEDNDEGSVMSEDPPVKVISVDITQRVPSDNT